MKTYPLFALITAFAVVGPTILRVNALSFNRPIVPSQSCFTRFAQLGFDLPNFDGYPRYFRDDSIFVLLETGIFQGIQEIADYIKFAYEEYSPYLSVQERVDFKFQFGGFNEKTGECMFYAFYVNRLVTDPNTTIGELDFQVASTVKVFFDVMNNYITRVYSYYAHTYLVTSFGTIISSPAGRSYICSVMEGRCREYLNTTMTTEECISGLEAMPPVDVPNGFVVGYSQGCRGLHAMLASVNASHYCSHLSFTPMADPYGKIKCQNSSTLTLEDFFTADDLDLFAKYMVGVGLDPERGSTLEQGNLVL